ncbi:MAG: DNA-formamidopyrimidine glycosylase family protein [Actinomycetota bacterium]
MPEGDTIRRLAERIRADVVGDTVTRSLIRHPRLATADLTDRTVLDAGSYGKHLFVRFDDRRSLHVHLLMQGRVRFDAAREIPDWRRRFELRFRSGARMVGVDIPLLHLVDAGAERSFTDHLGPDVCGDFDHDAAVARIRAEPDLPLGGSMLEQRNVAGWGNIYAVETPFVCGISPFRRVGEIDGIDAIVAVGAALIRTNAQRGPQNTTGRRLQQSDHWILTGDARLCPVCGTRVDRFRDVDVPWQRRTARCPRCQADDHSVADVERARRLLALHPAARSIDWDRLSTRS